MAPSIAQPDTPVARNFTSFSASLRCLDEQLLAAKRPRILISSTGIPDLTRKIYVGSDDMLVNAINQTNRKSRAYIFVDQALERANGQIVYQTRPDDLTEPRMYIRGSISQLDSDVVRDELDIDLDLAQTPNPPTINNGRLGSTSKGRERRLSVVSVDMHLVSWPSKTVIAGGSVANSMVVTGDSWGAGATGFIRMTGYDISLAINRVESPGQAVRNLIELGIIELLGRHASVPYWDCLQLRTTNETVTQRIERDFSQTERRIKIQDVQTYLGQLNYLEGPKTGLLDRKTRDAIARFQADEGLIASGTIDFDLFERLQERAKGRPILVDQPSKGQGNRAKQSGAASRSRIEKNLILTADQKRYRVGDNFRLSLAVSQSGSLVCFHQTSNGPITQIFPVDPMSRVLLRTPRAFDVPAKDAEFDIKFENKQDQEAVLCLLDPSPKARHIPQTKALGPLKPVKARSFQEIIRAYQRTHPDVIWQEVRKSAS